MDRAALIAQVQQAGQQALNLIRAGRLHDALAWCVRGLALAPGHPGLSFLAGVCHNEMGRSEAALGCFEATLKQQPQHIDALYNSGVALQRLGRGSDAENLYQQVLAHKPDYLPALVNLAMGQLRSAQFTAGWATLAKASAIRDQQAGVPQLPLPAWDMSTRQRVLVRAQTGLVDTLLFCSVLPDVIAKAETVGLVCDPRLHSLLAASFGDALKLLPPQPPTAEQLAVWDTQCSLVAAMGALRQAPGQFLASAAGYLTADGARAENLRAQLGVEESQTLIGISWRREPAQSAAAEQGLLLSLLAALAGSDRVLVSLEIGDTEAERHAATDQGTPLLLVPGLEDVNAPHVLETQATLIAACDQIVSVDNATAQLAGALGQAQSVLLDADAHWCWGEADGQSLFYANTRILRQSSAPTLAEVLADSIR